MIPKISVIVPCYNQGKYLAEALDSVINQTLSDWECIIVDDGSTDDSAEIAKLYVEKDKRIHYVFQQNSGPSAARNRGVNLTSAPLLFFLDGDDIIDKVLLEEGFNYMYSHPNCILYYTGAEYFGNRKGEFVLRYSSYRDLLIANSIDCACIVRRNDFNRIKGFDEQLRGYEDWEFFIRLLYHNDTIYKEPKLLFHYRVTDSATSVNFQAKAKNEEKTMYIYRKHIDKYEEYYGTPFNVTREFNRLSKQLNGILNSNSYKVGEKILSPLRYLKKYFSYLCAK